MQKGKKYLRDNTSGYGVDVDDVLRCRRVLAGYSSVRHGLSFDYNLADINWSYERGRQLAVLVHQALGYIPPMPQGLDLVRPVYIAHRLNGDLTGPLTVMRQIYGNSDGLFSAERYAAKHLKYTSRTTSKSNFEQLLDL